MKKLILPLIAVLLICCSCDAYNGQNKSDDISHIQTKQEALDYLIKEGKMYTVDAVIDEIKKPTGQNKKIIESVMLPTSMDIKFPNIDTSKIIPISSPLISTLKEKDTFFEELKNHGITDTDMTLAEYRAIESLWPMGDYEIQSTKALYPELANVDVSDWTKHDFEEYSKEQDAKSLKERFTDEQLAELERRGIQVADTFYLFKEYHSIENFLSKPDEELKEVIEGYYRISFSLTMGEEFYNIIDEKY